MRPYSLRKEIIMENNETLEALNNLDGDVEILIYEQPTAKDMAAQAATQTAVGLGVTLAITLGTALVGAGVQKISEIRQARKALKAQENLAEAKNSKKE